jgi:hypothetical protein
VLVRIPLSKGSNSLRIRLKDDFGLACHSSLPAIGEVSQGLRILSETWSPNRDRLTINLSGHAGNQYELFVWNAAQIASVEGARLVSNPDGKSRLILELPRNSSESASSATISIQFVGAANR